MPDARLLEKRNGVSFLECLEASIHSDLLQEWERLSGKKLVATSPIDRMIDEATGYDMHVMQEFADFCYTYVYSTYPGTAG